ncbi:50S ribosomal protein L25 [Candidatus Legionella polyplacis]|uniref:Large ribosomal subunit protein bL25 n=1 Tax=Candidatus Legionella polyplacis TaxID=2005262 RepID=A0ABZ2GX82_9GAMM
MLDIILEAKLRKKLGKRNSRRMRNLEKKIPAVLYEKNKKTIHLYFSENKIYKLLNNKNINLNIFKLNIENKFYNVIIKHIQYHPYKPIILHIDLQNLSEKSIITTRIPIKFINKEKSIGVKLGGIITYSIHYVEIKCQAQYLPNFITVDLANIKLGETIHLFDLKLPEKIKLTIDTSNPNYNTSVVGINIVKHSKTEEPTTDKESNNDINLQKKS